ncbi:MAG: hypothetical protein QM664_13805 [Flavihumibacter sp.]
MPLTSPYSLRRLYAGLLSAAFTVWKATINIVMVSTVNADSIKGAARKPVF